MQASRCEMVNKWIESYFNKFSMTLMETNDSKFLFFVLQTNGFKVN